jgi:hypothetical protein
MNAYDTTARTFPCGLGSLVSNLLQLEFALRVSLHLDEPKEQWLAYDTFRRATAGSTLPLTRLTSWENLGDLVRDFNAGQRARGAMLIDEGVIELRHMLAHGRITQESMDSPPYFFVRFAKPAGDRVTVESRQTVTLEWLEEQVRRTYRAGVTVWARIDEQRKSLLT